MSEFISNSAKAQEYILGEAGLPYITPEQADRWWHLISQSSEDELTNSNEIPVEIIILWLDKPNLISSALSLIASEKKTLSKKNFDPKRNARAAGRKRKVGPNKKN